MNAAPHRPTGVTLTEFREFSAKFHVPMFRFLVRPKVCRTRLPAKESRKQTPRLARAWVGTAVYPRE
jgi:hypothetical protein